MIIRPKTGMNLLFTMLCVSAMMSLTPQYADARNNDNNKNTNVNVNKNKNKNTNVNVNKNKNTNVNVNVDVDNNKRRNPVAKGVAIGTAAAVTAIAIGTVVNTLPSSGCTTVIKNGISYSKCGDVWYEPRQSGGNVTYVVVNP